MRDDASELDRSSPSGFNSWAVNRYSPSAKDASSATERAHAPCSSATADPSTTSPASTSTVAPTEARPVNSGVLSLVTPPDSLSTEILKVGMLSSLTGLRESTPGSSSESSLSGSESSGREAPTPASCSASVSVSSATDSLSSDASESSPASSESSSWSSASTIEFSTASLSSDNASSTLIALKPASEPASTSPELTMVFDNDTTTFRLVLLPARSVATTENPTLSGKGSKASGFRRTSPLSASIDKPLRAPSSKDSRVNVTPDSSDADAV